MPDLVLGTGCGDNIWRGFSYNPDTRRSEKIESGYTYGPNGTTKNEDRYIGPTWGDVFKQRIRWASFGTNDSPNRVHFVCLSRYQVASDSGKKWMKILHDEGFEFIRAVDNNAHSLGGHTPQPIYVFMLMRNIGDTKVKDPYEPPEGWAELKDGVPTAAGLLSKARREKLVEDQTAFWDKTFASRKTEFNGVAAEATTVVANTPPENFCPCEACTRNRATNAKEPEKVLCLACRKKYVGEPKGAAGVAEAAIGGVKVFMRR